ncbi:hypothetical protein DL96DRAFT_1269702 [Flagelloscypha sp. PMI_526]|nr:hypothetical protein DL96DRAFT_1269702 [Flagelloscypha sp. PMI_526]
MDESRDHGLKVLTLDGEADIRVGVLSALFSLLDMMRRAAVDHPELTADEANVDSSTNPNPEALPCKCFDLIVGSGDGGWVAIMLGRLSMTTSQVIQLYLQVRASIHNSYPFNGPLHTWNTGAMATAFEACLKLIVTTSMKDVEENLQFLNPTCYVVALAVHEESDAQHPAYFRNYVARANSCPNCPIWFAMRAVASSKIFPPALMGSTGQRFLAASHFSFNNPVNQAISEAIDLAKHLKITGPPLACLVSLGAGHPGVKAINILELEKTAIRLTQGAEAAHEQALNFLKAATDLSQEAYFRVNVEQGLQTAECQKITLEAVRTHTESYLQKSQIKDLMINIVDHILSGYARQTGL